MTEIKLANIFQDRTFTATNVAKVQNVRGERLTAETYYFKPGQSLAYHRHPDSEQVFLIFSGEGVFYLDSTEQGGNTIEQVGETSIRVKEGSVVLAPAGLWHRLDNTGDGDMVVAQISSLPTSSIQRNPEVH
ncbi:MAG: cupin domain-containing protein [Chloroflexota bacterium]